MKTIVLSGGHLSPAVAIAEECKKRGYHVIVFGRGYAFTEAKNKPSLEKEMFEEMKVDFRSIASRRFPSSIFSLPSYIVSFIRTTRQIYQSLQKIKPMAVVSFGGYVGMPLLTASFFLRIPIFLHEQTITAGVSNKIFSFFTQKVFTAWPETTKSFPPLTQNKILLTGNPVRTEVLSLVGNMKPTHEKDLTVYITGGSTGAHAINIVVAACLEKLLEKYSIIHQAGDSQFNDYEMLEEKRNALSKDLQKRYILARYINLSGIKETYSKSDIIVGRSGANTITEVAVLGKPALFIPLPLAQYNEQELLARKLAEQGTAIIINQQDLTEETLLSSLNTVAKNYDTYVKHGKTYRESEEIARHTDAGRLIVDIIERWDNNHGNNAS